MQTIQEGLIEKFNIDIGYYGLMYQRVLVIDTGYILCGDIDKYTDLFDVNGNRVYKLITWIGQKYFKQKVRKDSNDEDIATIVEYRHSINDFNLGVIVIEDFWDQKKNLVFDENGMSLVWGAYDKELNKPREVVDDIKVFKKIQDKQALCQIRTAGIEGIQPLMKRYYTALYDKDRLYVLGIGDIFDVNISDQMSSLTVRNGLSGKNDKYIINLISSEAQWNKANRWRRYQPGLKTVITLDVNRQTGDISNITSNWKKIFIDTELNEYKEDRYNEYD